MDTVDRLMKLLPEEAAAALAERRETVTEIRLRVNRPAQIVFDGTDVLAGAPIEARRLREITSAPLSPVYLTVLNSFYARETELARGFFTMTDGSRVGVCGRFAGDGTRLTDVGSVCVRIARAVPGCADGLMGLIAPKDGLRSLLIVSPPGLGKTTLLRDAARQLSEGGLRVGIADERHELAACHVGVPTLDVGPRTDVADGCPRPRAIRQLIRTMAPDVIVADEIGGEADAEALADAARCGVAVVASAHGRSLGEAAQRRWIREIVATRVLETLVLLGERPGHIVEIRSLNERSAEWRRA